MDVVVNMNIAAIRMANTNRSVSPYVGRSAATVGSMGAPDHSAVAALTPVVAVEAAKRVTNTIPDTSCTLDRSTLARRCVPLIHIRSATSNQMKAMTANGRRYRPTSTRRRRSVSE